MGSKSRSSSMSKSKSSSKLMSSSKHRSKSKDKDKEKDEERDEYRHLKKKIKKVDKVLKQMKKDGSYNNTRKKEYRAFVRKRKEYVDRLEQMDEYKDEWIQANYAALGDDDDADDDFGDLTNADGLGDSAGVFGDTSDNGDGSGSGTLINNCPSFSASSSAIPEHENEDGDGDDHGHGHGHDQDQDDGDGTERTGTTEDCTDSEGGIKEQEKDKSKNKDKSKRSKKKADKEKDEEKNKQVASSSSLSSTPSTPSAPESQTQVAAAAAPVHSSSSVKDYKTLRSKHDKAIQLIKALEEKYGSPQEALKKSKEYKKLLIKWKGYLKKLEKMKEWKQEKVEEEQLQEQIEHQEHQKRVQEARDMAQEELEHKKQIALDKIRKDRAEREALEALQEHAESVLALEALEDDKTLKSAMAIEDQLEQRYSDFFELSSSYHNRTFGNFGNPNAQAFDGDESFGGSSFCADSVMVDDIDTDDEFASDANTANTPNTSNTSGMNSKPRPSNLMRRSNSLLHMSSNSLGGSLHGGSLHGGSFHGNASFNGNNNNGGGNYLSHFVKPKMQRRSSMTSLGSASWHNNSTSSLSGFLGKSNEEKAFHLFNALEDLHASIHGDEQLLYLQDDDDQSFASFASEAASMISQQEAELHSSMRNATWGNDYGNASFGGGPKKVTALNAVSLASERNFQAYEKKYEKVTEILQSLEKRYGAEKAKERKDYKKYHAKQMEYKEQMDRANAINDDDDDDNTDDIVFPDFGGRPSLARSSSMISLTADEKANALDRALEDLHASIHRGSSSDKKSKEPEIFDGGESAFYFNKDTNDDDEGNDNEDEEASLFSKGKRRDSAGFGLDSSRHTSASADTIDSTGPFNSNNSQSSSSPVSKRGNKRSTISKSKRGSNHSSRSVRSVGDKKKVVPSKLSKKEFKRLYKKKYAKAKMAIEHLEKTHGEEEARKTSDYKKMRGKLQEYLAKSLSESDFKAFKKKYDRSRIVLRHLEEKHGSDMAKKRKDYKKYHAKSQEYLMKVNCCKELQKKSDVKKSRSSNKLNRSSSGRSAVSSLSGHSASSALRRKESGRLGLGLDYLNASHRVEEGDGDADDDDMTAASGETMDTTITNFTQATAVTVSSSRKQRTSPKEKKSKRKSGRRSSGGNSSISDKDDNNNDSNASAVCQRVRPKKSSSKSKSNSDYVKYTRKYKKAQRMIQSWIKEDGGGSEEVMMKKRAKDYGKLKDKMEEYKTKIEKTKEWKEKQQKKSREREIEMAMAQLQ